MNKMKKIHSRTFCRNWTHKMLKIHRMLSNYCKRVWEIHCNRMMIQDQKRRIQMRNICFRCQHWQICHWSNWNWYITYQYIISFHHFLLTVFLLKVNPQGYKQAQIMQSFLENDQYLEKLKQIFEQIEKIEDEDK